MPGSVGAASFLPASVPPVDEDEDDEDDEDDEELDVDPPLDDEPPFDDPPLVPPFEEPLLDEDPPLVPELDPGSKDDPPNKSSEPLAPLHAAMAKETAVKTIRVRRMGVLRAIAGGDPLGVDDLLPKTPTRKPRSCELGAASVLAC